MSKAKFGLAIAQNIEAQTKKVKQIQNKSNYKYFQNKSLNNQKPDLFVKSENNKTNVFRKSISQEITDRIFNKSTK